MSTRVLEASLNGRAVGELREANDLWEFEYSAGWLNDPLSFDLSPALGRATPIHRDGASIRPAPWC
jgi:serine/threonine-protein kinase HipA